MTSTLQRRRRQRWLVPLVAAGGLLLGLASLRPTPVTVGAVVLDAPAGTEEQVRREAGQEILRAALRPGDAYQQRNVAARDLAEAVRAEVRELVAVPRPATAWLVVIGDETQVLPSAALRGLPQDVHVRLVGLQAGSALADLAALGMDIRSATAADSLAAVDEIARDLRRSSFSPPLPTPWTATLALAALVAALAGLHRRRKGMELFVKVDDSDPQLYPIQEKQRLRLADGWSVWRESGAVYAGRDGREWRLVPKRELVLALGGAGRCELLLFDHVVRPRGKPTEALPPLGDLALTTWSTDRERMVGSSVSRDQRVDCYGE